MRTSPKLVLSFLAMLLGGIVLPTSAQHKKVLVIGVDGMRPDAMELAHTPHLNSLFENNAGLYYLGYNEDLTFSGPNWSSIINGVHHDRHGVVRNSFEGHDFSENPNFLRRLKNFNADLFTASFIAWDPLLNNFTKADGSPDGIDKLFHYEGGDVYETENDQLLTEELVQLLKDGDPDAIFIRIGELDGAGHTYGFSPDVPEYMEQVEKTDAYIGRILQALRTRSSYETSKEEWLIIVTTDHGGVGTGHSGNLYYQRLIPFIISGPSIDTKKSPIRPRNVDVAKTVLTFMGVPESEQNDLDGNPVGLSIHSNLSQSYENNLVVNGDAEYDRGFTDHRRDQVISGWYDQEHTGAKDGYHSMTVLQYGSLDGYPSQNSPGPSNRSYNFFAGGSKGNSSKMTQYIDLRTFQTDIKKRLVRFDLSGYLGGSVDVSDRMILTAYLLDEENQVIKSAILDQILPEDNGSIGLKYNETTGIVPSQTRAVLLELHAVSNCNDLSVSCNGINAFADNLSFVLNRITPN